MTDESELADKSFFTQLEEDLQVVLQDMLIEADLEEDQWAVLIESKYEEVLSNVVEEVLKTLRRSAPKMLRERRSQLRSFEKGNFRRWKKAFDLFEMMIVMAEELGELNDAALRSRAQQEQDYKFEALSQLHPRAVLVSREILCLLKGGFPDAALARWRTLHELTVTSMFIANQDQKIALNYLASFVFRSLRAAKQYNEHAERANLDSFSDEDINDLEAACDEVEQQIGGRLRADYDWAKFAFPPKNITFYDIEKRVGMDHWRPRYRWASQHSHAGHRPADRMLGLVETADPILLVGPSNSGFTDPLHMAAISLAEMTTTFMLYVENLDRLVHAKMMLQLSDELGPLAWKIERETFVGFQEKNREP